MPNKPEVNAAHPNAAILQAFVAGRLQPPYFDEVAMHLESCEVCASSLSTESLKHDPLVARMRAAQVQEQTVLAEIDSANADDDGIAAGKNKAPAQPTQTSSVQESSRLIGPYKMLQQIGHGGIGEVFMAEQEKPVRRRVALKLIKAGMDSQEIITRFEAERQALSMMDHQYIARVLDAGTTTDRRPYFVMELVNGIPITEYCDRFKIGRASWRERV